METLILNGETGKGHPQDRDPPHTQNREVRGGWGMGVATVLCMKLSKRKVLIEIALSLLGKQKHKLKK